MTTIVTFDPPSLCESLAPTREPLSKAHHLPGFIYTDPDIFEREKRDIFQKDWLCVGRVEEVGNPGDYLTLSIMDEPLLIVRDSSGWLRAFYNVCRHRGVAVASRSGNVKAFSCPYHGWTYDLAGRLVHAPHMEEAVGFDRARCGLKPVKIDEWQGWMFVNLDPDSDDLRTFLGTVAERFGFVHAEDCRLANKWEFELPCNWKLGVENFQDVYHLRVLHADTFGEAVDVESYKPELLERGKFFAFHVGGCMTPTGETLFAGLPCWQGKPSTSACIAHIGPNIMIFCRYDSVFLWICWPVRVDLTRIIFYTTFHKDHFVRSDFREKADEYARFERIVAEEDRSMIAALQRGLGSRAYAAGHMSPYEHTIHHMINHYLERMFGEESSQAL